MRANDQRMAEVKATVETRLGAIQADNEKKLEQIRATVDEKLHATLEQRLGESFRQVAERLEQVHRGIGEMQKLASDVGSLSRVLSNVKTRGTFGEVQLGALLEQVFAPAQYGKNVETIPGTNQRVDYAVKFPGRGSDEPVWLPIDCKFPREDYERLVEAHERADAAGVESSARAIETRLRVEARTIREKYLAPPHTTDFAILFVPTEGLYAEALRRPGLFESLQRDHRVTLAGPTTLLAVLTSLKVGFNTLALEQRSNEVREMLSVGQDRVRQVRPRPRQRQAAGEHGRQLDRRGRDANAPDGARARRASRRRPSCACRRCCRDRGSTTPIPTTTRMTERPRSAFTSALFALIGGQIALHSCMAGIRMAAPLAALREGHAAWAVGVLLGLFAAAPVVLALAAGRLADRHGYHVPIRVAVALTVVGGICAVIATAAPGRPVRRPVRRGAAHRRGNELRPDRDPALGRPHGATAPPT